MELVVHLVRVAPPPRESLLCIAPCRSPPPLNNRSTDMGDTEFDSFFDDAPAPAAAPAASDDPFGDAPVDAAPAGGDDFDFGAPAAEAPTEAPAMGDMGGLDMSAGMGDMSNAFVTTANLSDSGPLSEWRTTNLAKMQERAAESKAKLEEIQKQATTDRDNFYAQRQETIDATKKSNREAEAALKDSLASNATKDNLWESVVELVDLQTKGEGSDISRMRQTMLAMKNEKTE